MRYVLFASAMLLVSPPFHAPAVAADEEFRVIKLEQDVRTLERQVDVLSRQIGELRALLSRSGDRPAASLAPSAAQAPSVGPEVWLEATRWERLRPGMDELEVIEILGPPTSMRQEGDTRLLLYALEIGASGFLSGSVSMRERRVVEMEKPVLK